MKENGFYHDGIFNSVVEIGGKPFRHRVEILVLQANPKSVFLSIKPNGKVSLPGGSTEVDCSMAQQVLNELHEEAFLDAVFVEHMHQRKRVFGKDCNRPKWMAELPVQYAGYLDEIYCGTYAGKWHGHVERHDLDDSIRAGKFVTLEKAFTLLEPIYKQCIVKYLAKYETKMPQCPV